MHVQNFNPRKKMINITSALEPGPLVPESNTLTVRPLRLPEYDLHVAQSSMPCVEHAAIK